MSIFTIIKKVFSKNKLNNSTKKGNKNSIEIDIYDDGFYDINFHIQNPNMDQTANFAKVLYKVNIGSMYDDFFRKIDNISSDSENYSFIKDVKVKLDLLFNILEYRSENKNPMIKPSKVFGLSQK
jgi:hypothetical protein